MARRRRRWRSDLEARRTVRQLLRNLGVDVPLDVEDLCARLGEARGLPIRLVPYALPVPGPFGLWLSTTTADLILFQAETTKGHQEHIILHEVGHIISGHSSDETDDLVWRELVPSIPPAVIRKALRRTGYDQDHEREAEVVATVIKEWATLLETLEGPRVGEPHTSDSPTARTLRSGLGDHQGWL